MLFTHQKTYKMPLINIMGSIIRQHISTSVQKAKYFSLFINETKDRSKNKQMSICLQYLDAESSEIVERSLTFVLAPCLTAEYLAQYIVNTPSQFNINLSSMVSQGYDGATDMSGSVSGIQKCIRELVPQAVYIHCHAHCLNLVLVNSDGKLIMHPHATSLQPLSPIHSTITATTVCPIFELQPFDVALQIVRHKVLLSTYLLSCLQSYST